MTCYAVVNALLAPDLTPNQTRVWAYLLFRANGAKVCWPSVTEIAGDLHITPRSVMACTKQLMKTGRIKVTHRYKATNNYQMVDVAGLLDKPTFGTAHPTEAADSGLKITTPTPTAELKKSAVTKPIDLKKPSPMMEALTAAVAKTAEREAAAVKRVFSVEDLTGKIQQADLKKPAQHPVQQEREKVSKQVARAGAREAAEANALSQAEVPKDWVWSVAKGEYVPPPPATPPRHYNRFQADMAAMGSPGDDGQEAVNGINVQYITDKAMALAQIDPTATHIDQRRSVRLWLGQKIEPAQIFHAINKVVGRSGYAPKTSLSYFDNVVRQQPAGGPNWGARS